jgi:hypothetical protein
MNESAAPSSLPSLIPESVVGATCAIAVFYVFRDLNLFTWSRRHMIVISLELFPPPHLLELCPCLSFRLSLLSTCIMSFISSFFLSLADTIIGVIAASRPAPRPVPRAPRRKRARRNTNPTKGQTFPTRTVVSPQLFSGSPAAHRASSYPHAP